MDPSASFIAVLGVLHENVDCAGDGSDGGNQKVAEVAATVWEFVGGRGGGGGGGGGVVGAGEGEGGKGEGKRARAGERQDGSRRSRVEKSAAHKRKRRGWSCDEQRTYCERGHGCGGEGSEAKRSDAMRCDAMGKGSSALGWIPRFGGRQSHTCYLARWLVGWRGRNVEMTSFCAFVLFCSFALVLNPALVAIP